MQVQDTSSTCPAGLELPQGLGITGGGGGIAKIVKKSAIKESCVAAVC